MSNDQPTNREILNAIEKLTELVKPRKPIRQQALKIPVNADLRETRRETVLKVFSRFAKAGYHKRTEYKFPKCLKVSIPGASEIEAMPRSILVNQCSMRKVFRRCEGEESSSQNVLDTLEELNNALVVASLLDAQLGESETLCVFSLREAEERGLLGSVVKSVRDEARDALVWPEDRKPKSAMVWHDSPVAEDDEEFVAIEDREEDPIIGFGYQDETPADEDEDDFVEPLEPPVDDVYAELEEIEEREEKTKRKL